MTLTCPFLGWCACDYPASPGTAADPDHTAVLQNCRRERRPCWAKGSGRMSNTCRHMLWMYEAAQWSCFVLCSWWTRIDLLCWKPQALCWHCQSSLAISPYASGLSSALSSCFHFPLWEGFTQYVAHFLCPKADKLCHCTFHHFFHITKEYI